MFKLDFIVAGARRGGTTFLHNLLIQQVNCAVHKKADFDYFIDDGVKRNTHPNESNQHWEENHSREGLQSAMDFTNDSSIKGLKNADFLFWENSHLKAKKWFPELKIIIVLRDPVKRAYSHYVNEVIKMREKLSFEDAIKQEVSRTAESDFNKLHLSYIERGYYDKSLSVLYKTFDPKNVLVVLDYELYENPQREVDRIADFLGFLPSKIRIVESAKNTNVSLEMKKKVDLDILRPIIRLYVRVINSVIVRYVKERNKRNRLRAKLYSPFYSKINFKINSETSHVLQKKYQKSVLRLSSMISKDIKWFDL